METPAFLKPIQSYPGEIVQFIERIPGVDVTGDRETVLEQLEPYHKAEVEALAGGGRTCAAPNRYTAPGWPWWGTSAPIIPWKAWTA